MFSLQAFFFCCLGAIFYCSVCTEGYCFYETIQGHCCSIPFKYGGIMYHSCTTADYHRQWCSLDPVYKGRWGACVDKGDCSIKTVDGRCCSIPFTYKGIKYDSCTKPDPKYQWCSLDSTYEGRWGYCDCSQDTLERQCCSIPFTYNGVEYHSCTKADYHRQWCSFDPVYKGKWGHCVEKKGDCSYKTVGGKCCKFPFKYNGIKYDRCKKPDPNQQWCSLDPTFRGRWGYCGTDECAVNPCQNGGTCIHGVSGYYCACADDYTGKNCEECFFMTVDGKCCSIPFEYKGIEYNLCTKVDSDRFWCSLDPVYKGRWGNCTCRKV